VFAAFSAARPRFAVGAMTCSSSHPILLRTNDDPEGQCCRGRLPSVAASWSERAIRMTAHFRRQLAEYAEYHRDPRNCAAHVFGIIVLFLAAVLPLTLWPIPGFGGHVTLATLLALPVLIYWLTLDLGVGLGILAATVTLLSTAAVLVGHVNIFGVWTLTVVLAAVGIAAQVVGHKVFERRKPSMADHPAHFLLGPMFVMAKLFVALGFRDDLAAIIGPSSGPTSANSSGNRQAS
jgi:uncharacterized membrane protein YGL010W